MRWTHLTMRELDSASRANSASRARGATVLRASTLSVCLTIVAVAGCDRENRRFSEIPPTATAVTSVSMSSLQPGEQTPELVVRNPYEENAYAISEGKRLFDWMNCSGCHAHGGGAIGPALIDDEWIYGSDPENIYATIIEGRPNGMPAFRGKLTEQQVWQLVAYVRSMSGHAPRGARSGRNDNMQFMVQDQSTGPNKPKQSFVPGSAIKP